MDMEKLASILEAVKVLPLRPDDRIVLRVAQRVTPEMRDAMREFLSKELGGRRVIVLDGGIDIEILRPEQSPQL